MSEPEIVLRDVEKKFGNLAVVRSLNLRISRGEFLSLLGPSGCGKTTTLRMIAGLEEPTTGDIEVKGRRINGIPVHKRNFGMVFQNLALFPHRTAFDNIAFGLKYRNVAKSEIPAKVRRALDMVRLPHVTDRFPSQLSGGQQQRIAVARAIVIEPDLLLFDEPFSALDAGLREEMRIELKRIQKELGITTVFVTHDHAEALTMSDRVVVMSEGAIIQAGSPSDVYSRPESEFVARFFGHVNEVNGTVVARAGSGSIVETSNGDRVQVATPLAQDKPCRILVRSERIRVQGGASEITGKVTGVDYLGMMVRYRVEALGTTLTVIQPIEGLPLKVDQTVSVQIAPDAWMVLG